MAEKRACFNRIGAACAKAALFQRHGCNAALCLNQKCASTGQCQDVSIVESPSIAPLVTVDKFCLVHCGDRCDCSARTATFSLHRTLIAFTGLAGSGKSTVAKHLVERHGFKRLRFAGPLKDMMRALGLSEAEVDGDRKELPCELLGGKTPRHAMQTIGTEWGRDMIASDLWIRAFNAALAKVPVGVPVVVDDCRFPNEAAAISAAGGVVVRIERPGAGAGAAGHSSEGFRLPAVATLENVSSVPVLLTSVEGLIRDLSWRNNSPAEG